MSPEPYLDENVCIQAFGKIRFRHEGIVRVYTYTYTQIASYVRTYIHSHTSMHAFMHTYMHTCIYLHTYIFLLHTCSILLY